MLVEEVRSSFSSLGRRSFLKTLAAFAAAAAVSPVILPTSPVLAATAGTTRRLSLISANTRDVFDGVYWADGHVLPEAQRKLDMVLRDHKSGQITHIDPKLFDVLWEIQQNMGLSEPFEVVCGYRSRRTNALARRRSRGVAKQSMHKYGKAVDIRIHQQGIRSLANAARELEAGGVGYYPRNGFVHVDTGPVRHW